MSLTGGKRKVNKGLKDWVTFVKKVQKEEKLSYKDAIHRAKIRKDKGEKWMSGGSSSSSSSSSASFVGGEGTSTSIPTVSALTNTQPVDENANVSVGDDVPIDENTPYPTPEDMNAMGGRRRRTMRRSRGKGRSRSKGRGRSVRRGRGRVSRRH